MHICSVLVVDTVLAGKRLVADQHGLLSYQYIFQLCIIGRPSYMEYVCNLTNLQ